MESLQGQTPDCNAFLQLVDQKWQDHGASMLTLRNVFLYLDRSFVLQTPSLRSIWDMGLELFRHYFQVQHTPRVMISPWKCAYASARMKRGGSCNRAGRNLRQLIIAGKYRTSFLLFPPRFPSYHDSGNHSNTEAKGQQNISIKLFIRGYTEADEWVSERIKAEAIGGTVG